MKIHAEPTYRRSVRWGLSLVGLIAALLLSPRAARAWPGEFVPGQILDEPDVASDVEWGDFDADGDLDLAVTQRGGAQIYENQEGRLHLSATLTGRGAEDVAWGDWDNDGDLDLAMARYVPSGGGYVQPNSVFLNDDGSFSLAWESEETDPSVSVAWADWDNDGDLDLAFGNDGAPSRIYATDGLSLTLAWSAPLAEQTQSIDWGDWDADGDPDLALGNRSEPNRVYQNNGGVLESAWTSLESDQTMVVGWGDWDDDGDLDLAAGNFSDSQPSRVYANNGSGGLVLIWSFPKPFYTTDLDWGDYDGDGDLDLALASRWWAGRVYRNVGGAMTLAWTSPRGSTSDLAFVRWGDADRDGDLDLMMRDGAPRLHRNGSARLESDWISDETDAARDVAWGDWNNDGHVDLAVGNAGANRIYASDGYTLTLAWTSVETETTHSLAWGDADGDGDLDLAVGNQGTNRLYTNDGGAFTPTWTAPVSDTTRSVAWADWDRDGDLDLGVGNDGQPIYVYENGASGLSLAWTAPLTEPTTSIAWADWDGDGTLDLGVGNDGAPSRVYTNTGGGLTSAWTAPITDATRSVAWGDQDADGHPDLAVGNWNEPNRLYAYHSGTLSETWASDESEFTTSIAWGDWDGDGDLDLGAGNWGEQNRVYDNRNGSLYPVWASAEAEATEAIAWGDWDLDGDLDMAVGNDGQSDRIYANPAKLSLLTTFRERDATTSTAWGDWDGDGDPDLAVGNDGEANVVYQNDHGRFIPSWTSADTDATQAVAWGDWDGDGDLDLGAGNDGQNRVYENSGGSLSLAWSSVDTDRTHSAAWGDWDDDGDLDLGAGNDGQNRVYQNDGGSLSLAWSSVETDDTRSVAWGDWDSDGDLDLATGNWSQVNQIYVNDGTSLSLSWSSQEQQYTTSVAWGDWDRDGDLDLVVGNTNDQLTAQDLVYVNDGLTMTPTPIEEVEGGSFSRLVQTSDLDLGDQDGDGDLDLVAVENEPPGYVPYLHLFANDGDDLRWAWRSSEAADITSVAWSDIDADGDLDVSLGQPSQGNRIYRNRAADIQALPDTATRVRVTTPGGDRADLFHSVTVLQGPTISITYALVDPESDPVRRIAASYSIDGGAHWQQAVAAGDTITTDLATSPAGAEHTFVWDVFASGFTGESHSTVFRIDAYQGFRGAGPYQSAFRTARTAPFSVRGSQVRVVSGTVPMKNALVFRLPGGESGDYVPYQDTGGEPLLTGQSGYLQGWGEIAVGDRLVALAPITATDSYTLYYTNAEPTLTGVVPYTVTELGVQTIDVSEDYPLALLNLDVSLQWDARQADQFLSQLDYNLRRTSELLYDWTNGQVALGDTTLYHDREHWLDAHVRVYATNRMRPNAPQGGITSEVITDPVTSTLTYAPGQVHIGAVWNRYGDPSGAVGEDWPRTLAHELGHFALFLDDNYLGFSDSGLLIPVDTCDGTAMTDPYRDDFSEFRPAANWLPDCERTLSHQITGRADWDTIATFYPWLDPDPANTGPSGLPLAVTEIAVQDPVTPTTVLDVPYFYLSQDGHAVQPGLSARAFLFQDDRMIDLGRPTFDHVLARGASSGDRVCVFEPEVRRSGCEVADGGDEQLALIEQPDWLPDLTVSPVTSRTIDISVTNVPTDAPFRARLYPLNDPATDPISLTGTGEVFSGTFHTEFPALDGHIHVYVDEAPPRREIVTDFSIGGNPARVRGRWARVRGRWARVRGRWAPGVSADGQVILFGDLGFDVGEFFTLQAATRMPNPLPWVTPVGHAYRLSASPDAPDLTAGSLSFMYAGSEVPAGEESFLRIYFWDGTEWRILPTELDADHNNASCPVQGPGLYALMSSYEIPLYGPGWNNISYPLHETRPVTQALLSISGYYTTVYGYDALDDSWRMYDVNADLYANDLTALEYGHGYWINVSETITLYIGGSSSGDTVAQQLSSGQSPPSTFYGPLLSGTDFTPAPGQPVAAYVNGALCAEGETLLYGDDVVYALHVLADGPGAAEGCGHFGDQIVFEVAGQVMEPRPTWDNSRVRRLALEPSPTAQSVPLRSNWNLISFQVEPPEPSVSQVLSSIEGDYDRVLGEHGVYAPGSPSGEDTLQELHPELGYYVRVTRTAPITADIEGATVPVTTPIPLHVGWNWAGYLPDVTLPITQALQSIDGHYGRVLSLDKYYNPSLLPYSTLSQMQPGQGYLIYADDAVTLTFPSEEGTTASNGLKASASSCDRVSPTPFRTLVYGALDVDGAAAPVGTKVEAVTPRGEVAGCAIVETPGLFGMMHVYGQDSTADPAVPGFREGEELAFQVDGKPASSSIAIEWQDDWASHEAELTVTEYNIYLPLTVRNVSAP